MKTCLWEDCTNTVTSKRNTYCSPSCAQKANSQKRGPWSFPVEYGETKLCTKCKENLPLEKFGAAGRKKDKTRLRSYCKNCGNKRTPEQKARAAQKYLENRKEIRLKYLERQYNLSAQNYYTMLSNQNNSCAICFKSFEEFGGIALDHDHRCCPGKTSCGNCIRGLLCPLCNTGVGNFHDDPERLVRASNYIKEKRSTL